MSTRRFLLLGYGKMGTEIEQVARERGHLIVGRSTSAVPVTDEQLRSAEVAVDFSTAASVPVHVERCAQAGVPLVIGTTGWKDTSGILDDAAKNIGIIVGANFSVGVAIIVRLVAQLATMLTPSLGYQLHIHETHHRAKRDHPSGTALLLARTLQAHLPGGAPIATTLDVPAANAVTISSARVGSIVGIHTIMADSPFDTIEITHTAKSRRGFALGAVLAAEWIIGRRGLYDFADVAFEILAGTSQ